MPHARHPLTTFILVISSTVFFASVWHLRLLSSSDLFSIGDKITTQAAEEQANKNSILPPEKQLSDSMEVNYCKWVFETYESSPYEEQWFQEVPGAQSTTKEGPNICKAMLSEKHIAAARDIVGRVINLTSIDPYIRWTTYDSMPLTSLHDADKYMSRMIYRRVCYDRNTHEFLPATGHGVQLIEPLFGMLRDPFDVYCASEKLTMDNYPDADPGQSKHHILAQGFAPYAYSTEDSEVQASDWRTSGIPPWHSSLRPVYDEKLGTYFSQPQNIHMDLGSSYFRGWTKLGINSAASGKWFYDAYHKRGQKFDRFVAVEVEQLDDKTAFEQLPEDLVGIYTLMNVPLTMGEDKLNAIEIIKRLVKPEDFFVFKLDIDSAPIEGPIIQSLLTDEPENGGACGLVDELMFEHHVNYYPLNISWKNLDEKDDLLSSYILFRNLRQKGIRAHSWP